MALCIVLSYCFSGGETSLTVADLAKLHRLKSQGNEKAGIVIDLKNKKEEVISSILLGNNLVNILSSSVSAFIAVNLFGSIGLVLSTVTMTFIILIFAEILPKTRAINDPENVSIFLSKFLRFFLVLFYPVVKYINKITNILIFFSSKNYIEKISPSERIRSLILLHRTEHNQYNTQKSLDIINNIVDLTEIHVDKIMTHRKDIFSINGDLEDSEIIEIALKSDYKNIPIWNSTNDNLVNILNVDKLVNEFKKSKSVNLKSCLEKVIFVPNTTLISVQLHNFKVNKTSFSVVNDEYGNVVGVVTISDILEEILGDPIYTHNHRDIKKISESTYIVKAKLPVRDINKKIKTNFPTQYNQTLAGMIINEMERIPHEGEHININNCFIEILSCKNNRIKLAKVIKLKKTFN